MSKKYTGVLQGPTPPDTLPEFGYWETDWLEQGGWETRKNWAPTPRAENLLVVGDNSTAGITEKVLKIVPCEWHEGVDNAYFISGKNPLATQKGVSLRVNGVGGNATPAAPGQKILCSAYLTSVDPSLATGTNGFRWRVDYFKADGVTSAGASNGVGVADEGQVDLRVTQVFVAPAETAFAQLTVQLIVQSFEGDVGAYEVTAISIEVGATETFLEYFPNNAQVESGQAQMIAGATPHENYSELVVAKFADPTGATVLLYSRLWPHTLGDEDNNWDLIRFCEALAGGLFEHVRSYVADEGGRSGWEVVFDVDTCPVEALPYLAQFVGVRFEDSLTVAQQREKIKNRPAFRRGTPASIESAAKLHLTGTKFVFMEERFEGKAYRLLIRTFDSETPEESRTKSDITAQKPAGIVLDYESTVMKTYAQILAEDPTYTDWLAKGTYAQIVAGP